MITSRAWAGKRYAVLGLARSGLATVRALLASGAEVVAWDSDKAKREALKPLPFRGGGGGG
ncbi:MAG TPA: UDP-N-acetylmuramoyl-L-alanine--D-glutamate ligase, partial [Parvularcula sp.]|nr:UDP-N-acetylmuramoyl-L-alanine--D-glutamate ligase [Parvularcula sp.]